MRKSILYDNKFVIVLVIVQLTGSIQHVDITKKLNDTGMPKNSIDLLSFVMETWSSQ